jgi:hypothetical protein
MSLAEVINRGITGIPDRVANAHPQQWEQTVREIQARARMVALFETNSEKTESVTYNWWEKGQLYNGGAITDVYTDSGLASAYASGGVDGTSLYIKMALAEAKKVRENDLLFINDSVLKAFRRARVTGVTLNGASSYAAVKLLETDTSNALASASLTFVISNAHAEKGGSADPLARELVQRTGYVQRLTDATAMSIAESMELERATPKKKQRDLKDMLMRFREGKQLAFILGKYHSEDVAEGRLNMTDGFISVMETNESSNVFNYVSDADYSGSTWAQEGMDYLEKIAEITSRTGKAATKKVYTSSLAVRHLQAAVRDRAQYNITVGTDEYGLAVTKLIMPGQNWDIITDGTMSKYPMLQDLMLVVEPECVGQRVFQSFHRHEVPKIHINDPWQAECEEWSGFWWSNLESMAVVKGIGALNTA